MWMLPVCHTTLSPNSGARCEPRSLVWKGQRYITVNITEAVCVLCRVQASVEETLETLKHNIQARSTINVPVNDPWHLQYINYYLLLQYGEIFQSLWCKTWKGTFKMHFQCFFRVKNSKSTYNNRANVVEVLHSVDTSYSVHNYSKWWI